MIVYGEGLFRIVIGRGGKKSVPSNFIGGRFFLSVIITGCEDLLGEFFLGRTENQR
jgi:hypothetical protein